MPALRGHELNHPPTRVVLDCDTGVDDAMAILYGLLVPEIDVVGITCCWGNTWVETATLNTLRLLEIAQMPSVPVASGASKPLLGPILDIGSGVHGSDGQGNTNLPPPALKPVTESAAELLVRLAHEYPGELTLVPTAPLTNVATALALDPEIARLYKEVVLMGGNFLVPGNVARWGEANIWHDPEAAQMVLEAGWPITMVGLDVTMKTLLSEQHLEELANCGTPAARHVSLISRHYLDFFFARYGRRECSMHDALALAIAADRSLVRNAPLVRVDVELAGTHTRGMTVADLRPFAQTDSANAHVVLEVDSNRFVNHWMDVLCNRTRM